MEAIEKILTIREVIQLYRRPRANRFGRNELAATPSTVFALVPTFPRPRPAGKEIFACSGLSEAFRKFPNIIRDHSKRKWKHWKVSEESESFESIRRSWSPEILRRLSSIPADIWDLTKLMEQLEKNTKNQRKLYENCLSSYGAQWWECLPSANVVRVRYRDSTIGRLSFSLVLALLRDFLVAYCGDPPSWKTHFSKFQLHRNWGRLRVVPLLLSPSSKTRKKTPRDEKKDRARSWGLETRVSPPVSRTANFSFWFCFVLLFYCGFLSRLARQTKGKKDYS